MGCLGRPFSACKKQYSDFGCSFCFTFCDVKNISQKQYRWIGIRVLRRKTNCLDLSVGIWKIYTGDVYVGDLYIGDLYVRDLYTLERICAQRFCQEVLPKSFLRRGLCAKSLPKGFAKGFFEKGLPVWLRQVYGKFAQVK